MYCIVSLSQIPNARFKKKKDFTNYVPYRSGIIKNMSRLYNLSNLYKVDRIILCENSLYNSRRPSSKSHLKLGGEKMHILIYYHKNWGKRHSWNDHMLHSISIKTMSPQWAALARDLSCEEEVGGGDHMYVCMPPQITKHRHWLLKLCQTSYIKMNIS